MADERAKRAAVRLGAYYQSLLAVGADLTPGGLPAWAEPPRLRPAGWSVKGAGLNALSRSYFPEMTKEYERSLTGNFKRQQLFEEDLRIVLTMLRPALQAAADRLLGEQISQLQMLARRFARPGADDRLTASARRVLGAARQVQLLTDPPSAGTPEPPPTAAAEPEPGTPASNADAGEPAGLAGPPPEGSAAALPGGASGPVDFSPMPPYPRHLNRAILLNAIAQERRGLENGTLDQPDPRDGPAGARAHDSMAGPDAHEVSELLAALALPQESLRLLEAYEASPHAGSASVQVEIDSAIAATRILRLRLTRGASADDAWLYGPLVLAAVQSLGLSSVPAFPEFAVALGSQLGRTRTETLLSAAGLLLLGLTVVFTGPVGALAVGVLDLSFAGVELGVALLRQYERDLAASASTFRTEAEQLTPPDTDDSIPLAVAGAFLSAIGLAGAARPLLKLRARSPRQVATLELDNAVREFGTTTAEVEQAAVQAGNRRSLIRRPKPTVEMDTPGGRPLPTINDVARGLEPSTSGRTLWRSEDQMRKAAAKAKKQGGRKQLRTDGRTKERIESFALEPDEVATADRGTVRDVTEASQRETVAGTVPEREYGEADLEALSADVAPYPHLQDVPARGGATATWEGRAYDVFWKRPPENEPDLVAWARRQLPYGSPDPIAPWLIVGPKNPATLEHIVAVERIQKFHGFHRLSPANQKRVLNFRENLMALSSDVNSPLSSRTYAEWGNDIRSQVPPQFQAAFEARLAAMEAREKDLTRKLHDLIDTLLAEQNTTRGVSRPAPGRPGLGARLTGTALSTTATPEPGAEAEE